MRIVFWAPNAFRHYGFKGLVYPPLGLLYIAAISRERGHTVTLIDAETHNLSIEQVLSEISALNPDLVAISLTTPYAPVVAKELPFYKERFPKIPVVLGGPHPSAPLINDLNEIPLSTFLRSC